MANSDDKTTSSGVSRRDAMKASGAAAAGAMALFAALGTDAAGAASPPWKPADYANFAKLVNACWKSTTLTNKYHNNPAAVLLQYHIQLPPGTPAPVVPKKPSGSFGTATAGSKAWNTSASKSINSWDVVVSSAGGTAISVASIACAACPVSTFSSLSGK